MAPKAVFKTVAFVRSAILPGGGYRFEKAGRAPMLPVGSQRLTHCWWDDAAMGMQGPKGPDSFTLMDVGAGRHLSHGGAMSLERIEGSAWVEIARFGSAEEAGRALDDETARGTDAERLRLRAIRPHRFAFLRRRLHLG